MNHTTEFFQSFIGSISIEKVFVIAILYIIIHSKTGLGFILRVCLLWIVISTFRMNYSAYGLYHGIKSSGILAIGFYFPVIVKYIFKLIKNII